jgi:ATP-dependent Clp protease ATP-binding subunit ClpA
VATLHVRNVPEALYEALRSRAQLRGRSIGNEAIAILAENVARFSHVPPLGPGAQPAGPRERVSESSARLLAVASYEAHALGHELVETEHVLLALLGEGPVVTWLANLGASATQVREAIERHVEPGGKVEPGPRPLGAGAKRVLELALRESLAGGEGVIGPEHILVALAADEEGTAGRVLRELGIEAGTLRGVSILSGMRVGAGPGVTEEYCAIALTGSAEAWTEQLNALAQEGWRLLELTAEGGEQRAVFRRRR